MSTSKQIINLCNTYMKLQVKQNFGKCLVTVILIWHREIHYLDKSIGHPNFINCSKVYIIIGIKIFICYSLTCYETRIYFLRVVYIYFFCTQYNKLNQLILIFTLKMSDLLKLNAAKLLGFLKVALQKRAYLKRLAFLEQQ